MTSASPPAFSDGEGLATTPVGVKVTPSDSPFGSANPDLSAVSSTCEATQPASSRSDPKRTVERRPATSSTPAKAAVPNSHVGAAALSHRPAKPDDTASPSPLSYTPTPHHATGQSVPSAHPSLPFPGPVRRLPPRPPAPLPRVLKLPLREPLHRVRPRPRPHREVRLAREAQRRMQRLRERRRGRAVEACAREPASRTTPARKEVWRPTCRFAAARDHDVMERPARRVHNGYQPRRLATGSACLTNAGSAIRTINSTTLIPKCSSTIVLIPILARLK